MRKIETKKLAAAVTALALCAGVLTGCGGAASGTASSTAASAASSEASSEEADEMAAKNVADLIDAIYVQERNEDTDAQCEAAKAAWDALTPAEQTTSKLEAILDDTVKQAKAKADANATLAEWLKLDQTVAELAAKGEAAGNQARSANSRRWAEAALGQERDADDGWHSHHFRRRVVDAVVGRHDQPVRVAGRGGDGDVAGPAPALIRRPAVHIER